MTHYQQVANTGKNTGIKGPASYLLLYFRQYLYGNEIRHLDNRRENVAPLDKSWSCVTHDAHRKLAFSTLARDTLGIIPVAAGVVITLRTSAENSVRELIDYTT